MRLKMPNSKLIYTVRKLFQEFILTTVQMKICRPIERGCFSSSPILTYLSCNVEINSVRFISKAKQW